jgi:hypothetical protein
MPPPVRPPPRPLPSPRRAPAPPRHASPLLLVAWRWALLRPPQAPSPPPPPRLWARGARAATSRGSPAPIALHLLLLARRRVLLGPGRGEPLLLAQPELLAPLFLALSPPETSLPLARRPLLLPPLRRARVRSGPRCGWVGPHGVYGLYLC